MIKIKKIKEDKEKSSFLVEGIDFSLANAIRRSVFEIPTLAIDTVEFYKNDSALYDEILAHRLGLVPLKAPKNFTSRKECSCQGKGCIKCTASLKLKAEGPKTVYAMELKAKSVEPIYKEMPLVILEKGQKLEFSAEAILGTAKEHAKFSPGLLWFNALPEITIKGCDACGKCLDLCPKKAITIKDKSIIIEQLKCDMCDACVEVCKEIKNAITIKPSQQDFIFHIESFGQKSPKEIFTEVLEVLNENLKELGKAVK